MDDSICDWNGTINHYVMDISDEDSNNSSDSEWSSESRESDEESDKEWDLESEGNCVVLERMRAEAAQELVKLLEPSATEELMKPKTNKEWKEAGKSMRGVYTGSSAWTQRRKDKELQDKETKDAVEQQSPSVSIMRQFFKPAPSDVHLRPQPPPPNPVSNLKDFTSRLGYTSDDSETDSKNNSDSEIVTATSSPLLSGLISSSEPTPALASSTIMASEPHFTARLPPPLKRRKLEISYRVACQQRKDFRHKERELALKAVTKLIQSKRTTFDAGNNSLQATRACAAESCLRLVVNKGQSLTAASITAAEAFGLSSNHGARSVREWTGIWIKRRELPKSGRGTHAKTFSLLSDPVFLEGI
ncbi:hypothetical protein PM082_013722 [Marasmius tenuissimus]|nr:hypothetical protein PM082_013722 [Marasmius tenuissimus]